MIWLNEMKAHREAKMNTYLEKPNANPGKTKENLDEIEAVVQKC
jgi:hypothetical protein